MRETDPRWYVLNADKSIRGTNDINEWQIYSEDRRVAEDTVGRYWISTVFLGTNHNYYNDGPPILFETMVFDQEDSSHRKLGGLGNDVYMERCATWDQAVEMHNRVVAGIKAGTIPEKDEGPTP